MMNLEIANRLTALRKKNGFSQEELAEKIGVSRQAVSKWERGESSPDTDNLILLSRLYQVSLDDILSTGISTEELTEAVRQQSTIPAESILTPVVLPGPEPEARSSYKTETKPDTSLVYVSQTEPESAHTQNENRYHGRREDSELHLNLNAAYPILMTGLFICLGIFLNLWHPAWMVFLSIPLYYCRHFLDALVPIAIPILYLILGFVFNFWHPGWIMFFLIPLYYCIGGSAKTHAKQFFRDLP